MKNLKLILAIIITICLNNISFSQPPPDCPECPQKLTEKCINYQTVVRDTNGNILKNTKINILAKLLIYRKTDSIAYQETQTATTNEFGLMNLKIGTGIITNGSVPYAYLDWSLKMALSIEIDEKGGKNYHLMGVTRLLSVPYTLNAFRTDNVILTSPSGYKFRVTIDDKGKLSSSFIFSKCGDKFVDLRDEHSYNTVQIGKLCWMVENLNYGTRIDADVAQTANGIIEKYCYNDLESNCDIYGGLYQWDEMRQNTGEGGTLGICPQDWRVPLTYDLPDFITYLGGDSVAGGKLKEAGLDHWLSPNTGATNETGFKALPGGQVISGTFSDLGKIGILWGAFDNPVDNPQQVMKVYFDSKRADMATEPKSKGFSVRCVRSY